MNQVTIDGKKIRLSDKDVIGVGGEATVFRYHEQALKLYLQPDDRRDQKLRAMLPPVKLLPAEVISPQTLVYDTSGKKAVGFTMRLLNSDYGEVRRLSSRKFRATTGISAREVAHLFFNAGKTLQAVHQAGMVVGDLNDLNLMFRDDEMLYIDVDSFQFGQYPCMVGTEAFIDPMLYNCNLADRPYFQPHHDWYSFAVLLFKSLLLAHPYGGVHPTVNTLTARAQKRVSVFHGDVIYPKVAFPLELANDDLLHLFEDWFASGRRGDFPIEKLLDYAVSLKTCAFCGECYPAERQRCPHCSAMIPAAVTRQANYRVLVQTPGRLVAWSVEGSTARLIAHENGKAMLYVLKGQTLQKQMTLVNAMPAASYAFLEDRLVISPSPDSSDLLIVDVSGAKPEPVTQTTTLQFGNGERVFGAGGQNLYRLANGYLMRGQFRYGQFVEQAVMAITEDQTWLRVSPDGERVFGYFRVFNMQNFWLYNGRSHIDLKLSALESGEYMLDCSVEFAEKTMLILRLTQLKGREINRMDEIGYDGTSLHTSIINDVDTFTPLDAPVYARNLLLYATDKGIVREKFDDGAKTTFSQTETIVHAGYRLYTYEQGIVAVGDDRALYITT
jgi:hypothetical protein